MPAGTTAGLQELRQGKGARCLQERGQRRGRRGVGRLVRLLARPAAVHKREVHPGRAGQVQLPGVPERGGDARDGERRDALHARAAAAHQDLRGVADGAQLGVAVPLHPQRLGKHLPSRHHPHISAHVEASVDMSPFGNGASHEYTYTHMGAGAPGTIPTITALKLGLDAGYENIRYNSATASSRFDILQARQVLIRIGSYYHVGTRTQIHI